MMRWVARVAFQTGGGGKTRQRQGPLDPAVAVAPDWSTRAVLGLVDRVRGDRLGSAHGELGGTDSGQEGESGIVVEFSCLGQGQPEAPAGWARYEGERSGK